MEVRGKVMVDNQDAKKQDVDENKNNAQSIDNSEQAKNDNATIGLKGVSGKVITGTVKIKKANKSDKANKEKSTDATAAIAKEDVKSEDATSTSVKPRKLGNIKDLQEESKVADAVESSTTSEKTATPARKVAKKADETAGKEVAKTVESSKASESQDEKKVSAKEKLATAPAQPRKIKSAAQVEAEKAKQAEAAKEQNKSVETETKTASKSTTETNKDAKTPSAKTVGPRKLASGDSFASKGPRKISSATNDSLAATAKAFAKKKEEKENNRQRPKRKFQDKSNEFSPYDKDNDEEEDKSARSKPRKRKKKDVVEDLPVNDNQRAKSKFNHRSRSFEKERTKQDKYRERELEFTRKHNQRKEQEKKEQDNKPAASTVTHVALLDTMTVKEFAEALSKPSSDVIMHLMQNGVMATLNDNIDYETAAIIADEFGVTTERLEDDTEITTDLFDETEDKEEDMVKRPPVVVVMGHVDHGKTTLLDHIRNTKVAGGEAGGITQGIGAYMVEANGREITFLDTPGHEAFTTMRARGAQATDIAILVVAADDGIMPQTIEAINHAKAAGTEIIVAINKMDKPTANPDRIMEQLTHHELVAEDWGGDTVVVPISALTGQGVDDLLEMVLLTADVMELKVNDKKQAKGIIIEAELDKHRGVVVTALVQRGHLKQGDTILVDTVVGNVRAMKDSLGNEIKDAGPSVPVQILGLPEVPEVGSQFYVVEDERKAKAYAEQKASQEREEGFRKSQVITLDNLFTHIESGKVLDFNVIIKADVVGSVEALQSSLEKLNNDEIRVNVIHGAAGAINESDIRLAEASNAVVIGFNVRPNNTVIDLAKELEVDIRLYSVIYQAIEEIEAAMVGRLDPEYQEVILGHVEIRETYKVSKIGTIGGGYVTDGKITRNSKCRLIRDGIVVYDGEINSLRRFQDDVREVNTGYECGLTITNYNDLKVGDIVETYVIEEVERG
ncbi:translation initiation factor IF-2 [Fastidiosipila sanguinis]|uniref:Translation initiation factor IF-2 n=2 Tax=Fastidiosipila sanguinis TaxID=236753 RepID=A0A2S0KLJ8_9FIRM|nr:translation initiation factor IF-2 [Fastidiosipila sanguinis]